VSLSLRRLDDPHGHWRLVLYFSRAVYALRAQKNLFCGLEAIGVAAPYFVPEL